MPYLRHPYCRNPLPRYLRGNGKLPLRRYHYVSCTWRAALRGCKRLVGFMVRAMILCKGLLLLVLGTWHLHYARRAAQENVATITDLPERIEFEDVHGQHLGSIPWATTRKSIKSLDEVSPFLTAALLWMEDRGFHEHGGVNWRGVARAVKHDVATFSLQQGGSGITQQLAKMWKWGTPGEETAWKKFDRKFLEWHLASMIERHFSKDQILAAYLNRIDFGGGFHGVHAAADGFFGKSPKDLLPHEAATLVAIIRGPGTYSPIEHPDRCKQRRDVVLGELAQTGLISGQESLQLASLPLKTKHAEWAAAQRGSEEIRMAARELREAAIPADVLEKGGLTVRLTLDKQWDDEVAVMTRAHVRRLDPGKPKRPLQAAALVVETGSGAIKVFQAGRGDLPGDLANRVFDGKRQVGSIIKPLVYELAFEAGISPKRIMRNDALDPGELGPGISWSPRNAGHCGDLIAVRTGLIRSQNLITVRVGNEVGLEAFAERTERLGVASWESVAGTPTSFIGSFSSSLARVTRSFTIFRLDGWQSPPLHIVAQVYDQDGREVYAPSKERVAVADVTACRMTGRLLGEVFQEGTARHAREAGRDWIGKTGTTNGGRDSWFLGSDPRFTCGVWMGCDNPTRLNASGARFALPLWVGIMRRAPSSE